MEVDPSIVASLRKALTSNNKAFSNKVEKEVIAKLSVMLTEMAVVCPADPHSWLAQHMTRIVTKEAKFVEHVVLKLGEGGFFGEIALLSNKPRQATVRASSKASMFVISRDAFTRLCGSLVDILRRNMESYDTFATQEPEPSENTVNHPAAPLVLEGDEDPDDVEPEPIPVRFASQNKRRSAVFVEPVKIEENWTPPVFSKTDKDKERLLQLMQKTSLLGNLDNSATDTVMNAFSKKNVPAGTIIIKQGDDGDYFYILDTGAADALKSTASEVDKKVFEYKAGGSFGELALLHGEPRLATVCATEDCELWALDRDTFRKIMVTTGQKSMTSRTKFLDKVSLLKELQPYVKFRIAEAMELRHFEKGDAILKEGEDGNEFFIIQSGIVECSKRVLQF